MAFGKYTDDVTGTDVLDEFARRLGDLGAAMDSAEALVDNWNILEAGKTNDDIATQLFGSASAANLQRVTDLKDAITAITSLRSVADGDNTVTIWTLATNGKTFASAIIKFT